MTGKYFSRKIVKDGEVFDSKAEFERYKHLQMLERAGEISELERQPRYEVLPKLVTLVPKKLKTKVKMETLVDEKAKHYTADFKYKEGDHIVVEEVKSSYTKLARDYPLKRHLFKLYIRQLNMAVGHDLWVFREVIR